MPRAPRESDPPRRPPTGEEHEAALEAWAAALPELIPHADAHHPLMRLAALLASLFFFGLGIVGWLLPIVTGIPFHVLGLVTLGLAVPAVARRVNAWEERRSPRTRYLLHRMQHRLRRMLRMHSTPPTPPPRAPSRRDG